MVQVPPYLKDRELSPLMPDRPRTRFFIRPDQYQVVDGDTIRVLAPGFVEGTKYRNEAFRIRLATVDAQAKPKPSSMDKALMRAGRDPFKSHPGRKATNMVRDLCKGRCLYIEPVIGRDGSRVDVYGRLLADITISGCEGPNFNTHGARALAPQLVQAGLAYKMRGRDIPPVVPLEILALDRQLRFEAKFGAQAEAETPPSLDM